MTPTAAPVIPTTLGEERVWLPDLEERIEQDEEWCWIETSEGRKRRIRFHDYNEIFSIPGLYEHIFYELLECDSPRTVVDLLQSELRKTEMSAEGIRALDVGAGNGMVAERLEELGVDEVVGLDIIPEARDAALRDRPEVYDEYLVQDLTRLPKSVHATLEKKRLNCLVTVAALGFGDIPPRAFATAYNLVSEGGWIAFNLKEDFLDENEDSTGFSKLIRRASRAGILEVLNKARYRHRLSVTGESLYYIAIVARKARPIPESLILEVE